MQRLAGFPDIDQRQLAAAETLKAAIFEVFAAFGYTILEPPIIELPDAFIERSGEGIRDKMYFLQDPRGRQLCLRPELTIPTCRMLLRSSWDRQGVIRAAYCGPVFRYEATGRGRYRQFGQIGAECVGRGAPLIADAEIVALAAAAAKAGGVARPWILLGDVRLLNTVLQAFGVPEKSRPALRNALAQFNDADELRARLRPTARVSPGLESIYQDEFMDILSELGPDRSVRLIERFLAMSDISLVGTRKIHDIVSRLTGKDTAEPIAVSDDVLGEIIRFAAIAGEPARALEEIERFCRSHRIDVAAIADESRRRLGYVEALGIDLTNASFEALFRRSIDYYTGFIFEVYADQSARDLQLAGGGRYDQLMSFLDPTADIPAVGFALGLERLLLLNGGEEALNREPSWEAPVDTIVVGAGQVDEAFVLGVAARLRAAGWRVQVDLLGRRPRKVLTDALAQEAPYVVFVGEAEAKAGNVMVRHLASRKETLVAVGELDSFARARRAEASSS